MPPWVTGRRSIVRRTVTSVVSRIGIASTSSGSTMLVSVAPAVVQLDASASEARPKPITWLPESPMKTPGAAAGPQVEGKEAEAGAAERERDDERELARVLVERGDREDGAGHRRERRGEAVHVVEQVERVRDPDEPDEPDRRREQVVADDLDRQPGCQDESRRRELRRQLRDRLQRVDVVDEAGDEEDRAAAEDPEQLAARVGCSDRDRRADSRHEAEEDADPAEDGRRASMPALTGGIGDEPAAHADAQQRVEGQRRDGQRGDRSDRVHGTTG